MLPAWPVFEYAVLRVVPRVEREEFVNVGVVLFCRAQHFLQCRCAVPAARVSALAGPQFDFEELEQRLAAFGQICRGQPEGGLIGRLALAERFRWLTATRSTVLQTSPVHPGLTADAAATLARLFGELVA